LEEQMKNFANASRPWLGILALALGGIASCSNGADNTMPVGGAGTTGAAGSTAGPAGTTGTAGSTSGSAGQSGNAGTTGTAGTTAAGGSTGSAGDSGTAGSTGTAGGSAGGTGTAGGSGAAGSGVGAFPGPFDCTLVAGLLTTGEWYNAGFENDGVDGTKWEGKFQHYGYIDIWAQDPPAGFSWNAPISSACTKNSTNPDRVIYVAWSWELAYMLDKYVEQTTLAVKQFFKYYPGLKRMDLMTLIRCPGNEATNPSGMMCNPNAKIPPIAGTTDHNAGQQDCYVNKEIDQALDLVAAKPEFAGKVFVGKKFFSPACRVPVDGAHLGNNNTQVAKDIATWYKDLTHL
jgi:hypothetical protein